MRSSGTARRRSACSKSSRPRYKYKSYSSCCYCDFPCHELLLLYFVVASTNCYQLLSHCWNMTRINMPYAIHIRSQHLGSRDGVAAKIDADTNVRIAEMNQLVDKNMNLIIDDLLGLVYDIQPECHQNFFKAK